MRNPLSVVPASLVLAVLLTGLLVKSEGPLAWSDWVFAGGSWVLFLGNVRQALKRRK